MMRKPNDPDVPSFLLFLDFVGNNTHIFEGKSPSECIYWMISKTFKIPFGIVLNLHTIELIAYEKSIGGLLTLADSLEVEE